MKSSIMCMLPRLTFAMVTVFASLTASADAINDMSKPILWLIGDSTVRNNTRGLQGWGSVLEPYFDQAEICVSNRALGGRSSRTFFTEGLWEKVRSELKPGDFVIMQFGHNDGGSLNSNPTRASLKGIGEVTEEVTLTNGTKQVVHTYGWYLRTYIREAKEKSATPIVCSLVPRNDWEDGKVLRASNGYGGFAAAVAREEGVPFIDLNELTARKYEAEGQEVVAKKYFLNEHTHTTPAGAELNAQSVVEGIRSLEDCPLVKYLKSPAPANNSATAQK